MATCYKCGGEIEFYHNGFNAVPIHVSGSCWLLAGRVDTVVDEGGWSEKLNMGSVLFFDGLNIQVM